MRTCEASAATVYVSFLTKFLQEATRVLGKACWVSRVSQKSCHSKNSLLWLCWMNLGDKVVFVRFCLGWIMNSSAWNIVSFLSFSMFHPVSIHSWPNFIHFPSGFIQFFQQFELSSIYDMISQSFSSALLERSIQVSSLFMTKKEGVQSATAPRRSVLVLISVSVHSRKSGRARSYNQSFPTKLSKYRLEHG